MPGSYASFFDLDCDSGELALDRDALLAKSFKSNVVIKLSITLSDDNTVFPLSSYYSISYFVE